MARRPTEISVTTNHSSIRCYVSTASLNEPHTNQHKTFGYAVRILEPQDMFFRSSLTLSEVKQLAFQIQLMIKRAQTVALGKAGPKPDAGASSSRIRQVKAVREPARSDLLLQYITEWPSHVSSSAEFKSCCLWADTRPNSNE